MAFSEPPTSRGEPEAAHRPGVGRHADRSRPSWAVAVGLAVLVGVVVGVGVYLAQKPGKPLTPVSQVPAAARSTRSPDPATAAVASCQAAWAAQAPVLKDADHSLTQWQTHVNAMNALVAGKITFAQASRFWERTRVGAQHRVNVFEAANRALRSDPNHCTMPATPPADSSTAATLRACVRGVRLRNETLAAAQQAIATWQGHIKDMEMLRQGKMSPSTAAQMWLRRWHKGQRQIDDYESVRSMALTQHC